MFAYIAELERELAELDKADRAYQTTMAATEILDELTIQKALAESDAGRSARTRLETLAHGVGKLVAVATTKLPVGGDGLVVTCP